MPTILIMKDSEMSALTNQPAIRKAIAAEQAKAESRKTATRQTKTQQREANRRAAEATAAQAEQQRQEEAAKRALTDHANALATAKVDAEATGTPIEAMLELMGIDATGAPIQQAPTSKSTYNGPMLALRKAAKHYVKPANGILCNGDSVAMALGAFKPAEVISILMAALKLSVNPYLHLNIGQQSMNLRNRARHQLTVNQVKDAIAAFQGKH